MVRRRSLLAKRIAPKLSLSTQGYLRLAMMQALSLPLCMLPQLSEAAPAFGSAAWFAQSQNTSAKPTAPTSTPNNALVVGGVVTPQQALKQADRSLENLRRTLNTVMQTQRLQQMAAKNLLANANVANGLTNGGLQVAAGAEADAKNPSQCVANFNCLWQNANLPTQTTVNGQTTVNIQQTAAKAILTWDSFNVGAQTTLNFDQKLGTQTDGKNDWIALNRINASSSPSQILGKIKADGSVYLINPNGIIFGQGSQVNVHSLLASSLPIYLNPQSKSLLAPNTAYVSASNKLFLERGINSVGTNTAAGNLLGINSGQTLSINDNGSVTRGQNGQADTINYQLPKDISIEQGANIRVGNLGYALIAAPNVNNEGTISTDGGQVILAAGLGVSLKNPASGSVLLNPTITGKLLDTANNNKDVTPVGTVSNTGLIQANRGDVRLQAGHIQQDGVIIATTSISRAGSINISAQDEQATDNAQARTGSVVFGANSVTTLLPDKLLSDNLYLQVLANMAGQENNLLTIINSQQTDSEKIAAINQVLAKDQQLSADMFAEKMNSLAKLLISNPKFKQDLLIKPVNLTDKLSLISDKLDETTISSPTATQVFQTGSINITGGAVTLKEKALIEAPAQKVNISAISQNDAVINSSAIKDGSQTGRVFLDKNAVIDVAGLADIQQSANTSLVTIPRLGLNELADSPLLRNSFLYGKSIIINGDISGTRNDGVSWVGTPLANLSGYVQQVKRTVDLLLQNGGTISLAGNEVLSQESSLLNLDGGYSHYLGGYLPTTRLVTETGRVVDIANADPTVNYVGIAGQFVEDHQRWNSSQVYINPIVRGDKGIYVEDYIKGGNAGTLNLYGVTTTLLSGDVSAKAVSGRYQVAGNQQAKGGTVNYGATTNAINAVLPSPTLIPVSTSFVLSNNIVSLNQLAENFNEKSVIQPSTKAISDTQNLDHWTPVDVNKLEQAGVANVNVVADTFGANRLGGEVVVNEDVDFEVQYGGKISLSGSKIKVDGKLTSHSGAINLVSTGRTFIEGTTTMPDSQTPLSRGDISIGSKAVLDTSGLWINDTGKDANQIFGSAYSNGGSVSLVTQQNAINKNGVATDTTGSINLSQGSVIDVSSGGYVANTAKVNQKNLVPIGKSGDVSLETYVPAQLPFGGDGAPPLPSDDPVSGAKLNLAGTIKALGFSGGGKLSLRTLGLQIGGSASEDAPWTMVLPENYFDNMGFGHIYLQAEYDAKIAEFTTLKPRQLSYVTDQAWRLSDLPSFSNLLDIAEQQDYLKVGQWDDSRRQAVNLSIYAGDFATWQTNQLGGLPPDYTDSGITGAFSLEKGAAIQADNQAKVTLGSMTQVNIKGSVVAHGGEVTITADTARGGYAQVPGLVVNGNAFTSDNKSIWLSADSLLDVSGTTLLDPLAFGVSGQKLTSGKVLDGGTVTITNDTGYVIAVNCQDNNSCTANNTKQAATINVSGTTASLDLANEQGQWQSQKVASNAGKIRIGAAKGLYFHGNLQGHSGDNNTEGASLAITPLVGRFNTPEEFKGAKAIHLTQHLVAMPDAAKTPTPEVDTFIEHDADDSVAPTGILHFAADSLKDSGISSLNLGVDPKLNSSQAPLPIIFSEDVKLSLSNRLNINMSMMLTGVYTPNVNIDDESTEFISQFRVFSPSTKATLGTIIDEEETVFLTGKVEYLQKEFDIQLDASYVNVSGLHFGANYPLYYTTDDFDNLSPADVEGNLLMRMTFAKDTAPIFERIIERDEGTTTTTTNLYAPTTDGSGLNYTVDSRYVEDGELVKSRDDETFVSLLPKFYKSKLTINADAMDLGGQFMIDGFANVALNSKGDMRFVTPSSYDYLRDASNITRATAVPGLLQTTAELNLNAGQLYPATGNKFIVNAMGHYENHILKEADDPEDPETTYTYSQLNDLKGNKIHIGKTANSRSSTPLSVGGSLVFNAETINQGGVIKAPQGEIVLGAISANDSEALTRLSFPATNLDGSALKVQVPVIQTKEVNLLAGSQTSVSLENLLIPYGMTADGQNLQYNGSASSAAGAATSVDNLKTAPNKMLSINGQQVNLASGASINVAGGGDLQAQEWIAGTGGSRDVLAAYNTSYATGSATQVPLYADGRPVYAIVKGVQPQLAAYDPQFMADPLIGQSVYLSGIDGLAAGTYTLLPARYATLLNAYRIVQDTALVDSLARDNTVLADGTLRVAGYFKDSISGNKSARTTSFFVQKPEVWQQYSQYQFTSLNTYFANNEATKLANLPKDAGQLVLNAQQSLSLGAKVNGQAVTGGLGADINIAAPNLLIANKQTANIEGFVRVDVDELNKLNAGRLVLGGTSTRQSNVDLLKAKATQVVVDTAGKALTANEIIVMAQSPQPTDEVPEPTVGAVTIKQNSILQAQGNSERVRATPLQVGLLADFDDNGNDIDAANGNGALLRLSSGKEVLINRINVAGIDGEGDTTTGNLNIGNNVSLVANSISLDATGNTNVAASTKFAAQSIDANGATVIFSENNSNQNGLVLSSQLLQQLSAIDKVTIRSRSSMAFNGNVNINIPKELTLSAASLVSDGGQSQINSERLTLGNDLETGLATSSDKKGQLVFNTKQFLLQGGKINLAGFDHFTVNASQGMASNGVSQLEAQSAQVTFNTPVLTALTGSQSTISTQQTLTVNSLASQATPIDAAGGKLTLKANGLTVNSQLQANSGKISLDAGTGELLLGDKAKLDVSSHRKDFYDVTRYSPAGDINLQAQGDIKVAENAQLNLAGLGDSQAGQLRIQGQGKIELLALANAKAKQSSQSGRFSLTSTSAVDLNNLVDWLNDSGFQRSVNISSKQGNLVLAANKTLNAHQIQLQAQGGTGQQDRQNGNVIIDGTLNAANGQVAKISLEGRSSVQINGQLLANNAQQAGEINLMTSGQGNGQVDANYGYRLVDANDSGKIVLAQSAVLNVASAKQQQGNINLRLPLLANQSLNLLNQGASINNQALVSIQPIASWHTTDSSTGNQHFDGIIDPAGAYGADGKKLTNTLNSNHQQFYGQTLAQFIQQVTVDVSGWGNTTGTELRKVIELVNPSTTINDGNITVLSHWNLAAQDNNQGVYRTDKGIAPILQLTAEKDIQLKASLSDGFQLANKVTLEQSGVVDPDAEPSTNPNSVDLDNALLGSQTSPTSLGLLTANLMTGDSSSFSLWAKTGDIRLEGKELVKPSSTDNRSLAIPTMLRTGVGNIDLKAGNDIAIVDTLAPAVIYSAGKVEQQNSQSTIVQSKQGLPLLVNNGLVNSSKGGNITLVAGRHIIGQEMITDDANGTVTGQAKMDMSQFWWPWLQNPCFFTEVGCGNNTSSAINLAMFNQGILSVGGDVDIAAQGNIRDLSVSLPTTWTKTNNQTQTYGGGNLDLYAGGNLLSGTYFVAKGTGNIKVDGVMSADLFDDNFNPIATLFGLQDAKLNIVVNSYAEAGGVFNPSWLFAGFDSQSYSANSAFNLQSIASSVVLGNLATTAGSSYGVNEDIESPLSQAYHFIAPAHVDLVAAFGSVNIRKNLELYPSATGQLNILADGNINLINNDVNNSYVGLIDADASVLPSIDNPIIANVKASFIKSGQNAAVDLHTALGLHRADNQPMRLYSVTGSLVNGHPERQYNGAMIIASPKFADIRAGLDIVNLSFMGQHLYASDVTNVQAGRDFYNPSLVANQSVPFVELGGLGALNIQAGRNLGPLTSANDALTQGYLLPSNPSYPAIRTIANKNNAYLPRTGADIHLAFGLSPEMQGYDETIAINPLGTVQLPTAKIQIDAFANTYLNPAVLHNPDDVNDSLGTPDYRQQLVNFVGQYQQDQLVRTQQTGQSDLLTAAQSWSLLSTEQQKQQAQQAWQLFSQLPIGQRQRLVSAVFLDILNQVGLDYNRESSRFSGQYGRGYKAIDTLFPASLGFTANSLTGKNGAQQTVKTGVFDMRGSTVQTQKGGDIAILGAGGQILVGSTSAPPQVAASQSTAGIGPSSQGILTLEKGKIGLFTDGSVLLAQSRIFSVQGGDLLIWSSNGDVNAGKGAKTSSEVPPLKYECNIDQFCLLDAKSQVSGAGIAVLPPKAGEPEGTANLIAPVGTVDAGDAGIRVSGSLNVAAFKVANADNIQVQGKSVGVPTGTTDTAALSSASSVAAAAQQSADAMAAARQQQRKDFIPSNFLFEFIGGDDE
ncbi:filamentous haemagglutinin family protein [Agitococcus lubricus]|uniref:Filamentous hemagglutinin family protein n=1 Tax=Agitococcus lubricus TaxID=1077255 RepID=A0A2T5IU23_9GAMM|nr:filamentous haemagglutinin family protein [Agitococcus lubricus]PTQ87380.1 filamentous hemagglutinin family protein [Agitococcus lubricus]